MSTITLSFVKLKSISKKVGIIDSVFSHEAMQFSGYPSCIPPRWALMMSRPGT